MKQYEYSIINLGANNYPDLTQLNEWGLEGWVYVEIWVGICFKPTLSAKSNYLVLRRELNTQSPYRDHV